MGLPLVAPEVHPDVKLTPRASSTNHYAEVPPAGVLLMSNCFKKTYRPMLNIFQPVLVAFKTLASLLSLNACTEGLLYLQAMSRRHLRYHYNHG